MRIPTLPALLLGLGATAATLALSASRPSSDLDTYVLFAGQQMKTTGLTVLDGNVGVNSGQLIVRRQLAAPLSQLTADTIQFQSPQGACSVAQLFVNHGADATTPCGVGTTFVPPALGPGLLLLGPACHFPPSAATCPSPNPPATFVAPGDTLSLPPGVYGDIVVRGAAGQTGSLIFQGGNYTICGMLRGTRRSRIQFNGPTTIQITSDLRIGDRTFAGATAGSAVTANDIRIFSSGEKISFRQRAEVHGIFCAPHGRIHIDQRTVIEGRVVGQIIRADRDVTIGPSGSLSGPPSSSTTTTTTVPQDVCGNHRREGSEVCDPPDFGTATCPGSSVAGAFLVCDNCRRIVYDNCPGVHTTTTSTSTSTSQTSSTRTTVTTTSSSSTSSTVPVCGNGILEEGEACDPPEFGGVKCPGSSVAGAFLGCSADCTQIDTSSCPRTVEICGNCVDDDGNGLTDFEDPACCVTQHRFSMILSRGRIVSASGASRLRLRSILARAGLARVDPSSQGVTLQLRSPTTGSELMCAQIPADRFLVKGHAFRFRDKTATLASARGLTALVVRIRPDGSVRFRARGKQAKVANVEQGRLEVTVGFRSTTNDGQNRCSSVTQLFRPARNGGLLTP